MQGTIRIKLSALADRARSRAPGYLEDVLSHGSVTAEHLHISRSDYANLRAKYSSFPSALTMAKTALADGFTTAARLASGQKALVNQSTSETRLQICQSCDQFSAAQNRCLKCGCFLSLKTTLAVSNCPLGKW